MINETADKLFSQLLVEDWVTGYSTALVAINISGA